MKTSCNSSPFSNRIPFFLMLIILTSIEVHGQVHLKIISGTDSSRLPYATLANLSKKTIYFSNDAGEFTINQDLQDTFQVTYVGYRKETFVPGKERQTVLLYPKKNDLKTVFVSSCKLFERASMNNLKGDNEKGGFAGFMIGQSTINGKGKVAMLLKSPDKNAIITSFSFWLKKAPFATEISILNPLMITFYEVDDSTDKPGQLISESPIFYFPKKAGKQTISLDSLRITIPKDGIYISFQYILDEKYKWSQHFNSYLGSGDTTIYFYGSLIEGVSREPCKIAFYDIAKDEWMPSFFSKGQIKYDVELKYCKE